MPATCLGSKSGAAASAEDQAAGTPASFTSTDESIDAEVAKYATENTYFFGLKVCTEIESGRLTSVQFYLKTEGSDELKEMPRVGPELPDTVVSCRR